MITFPSKETAMPQSHNPAAEVKQQTVVYTHHFVVPTKPAKPTK